MIAQFLNSAIVVLLTILVTVPAAMAITKSMRERAARRQTTRVRGRQTMMPASAVVPLGAVKRSENFSAASTRPDLDQAPKQRESSQVYRRLRKGRQNPGQTEPGDRVRSPSERPARG